MFVEPQTVIIDGESTSLNRVTMERFKSQWGDPAGPLSMTISHDLRSGERSLVRLDLNKVGPSPLDPDKLTPYKASAWVVVSAPANGQGFDDSELEELVKGLTTLLNTSGFLTRLLGKES